MVGCAIRSPSPEASEAALTKVEQAMIPATADQAEGWLVMLQAATAHRNETEATSAVAYALYASELRRWPADVAKHVCENIARGVGRGSGPNWFPTLAEIAKDCEKLSATRTDMFRSLGGR